jgi:hypothetical protein
MYRCRFTCGGHVVAGIDLEAGTLEEAVLEAQRGFAERFHDEPHGGFEIWSGPHLLHVTLERPAS